jgi:hypothetical protein
MNMPTDDVTVDEYLGPLPTRAPERSTASSSRGPRARVNPDEVDEQEEIDQINRDIEQAPTTPRTRNPVIRGDLPPALRAPAASSASNSIAQGAEPIPGAEVAIPGEAALQPLAPVQKPTKVTKEDEVIVQDLFRRSAPRVGDGGSVTIQVGDRMNTIQDLLGTPHGRICVIAFLCRRPA